MAAPQQKQRQQQENVNMQELQETVSRLSSHKGVEMVMILNRDGDILVQSGGSGASSSSAGSSSSDAAIKQAKLTRKVMDAATVYLQSLEEDDEVSFLQIRSKKNREIMISPHQGFVLAICKG